MAGTQQQPLPGFVPKCPPDSAQLMLCSAAPAVLPRRDHLRGQCRFGRNCRFAHPRIDPHGRPPSDLYPDSVVVRLPSAQQAQQAQQAPQQQQRPQPSGPAAEQPLANGWGGSSSSSAATAMQESGASSMQSTPSAPPLPVVPAAGEAAAPAVAEPGKAGGEEAELSNMLEVGGWVAGRGLADGRIFRLHLKFVAVS